MLASAVTGPPPDAHHDYAVTEAAEAFGLSAAWLRALVASGRIPHYRHGRRITFGVHHLAEIRSLAEVRPPVLPAAGRVRRRCRHVG